MGILFSVEQFIFNEPTTFRLKEIYLLADFERELDNNCVIPSTTSGLSLISFAYTPNLLQNINP